MPTVAVIAIVLIVSGRQQTQSVSHVVRQVQKIALGKPEGGLIGPWWISAATADPVAGELIGLKVEVGPVLIAARKARIVVDPVNDTFRFEMSAVMMTRIDDPPSGEEHHLVELEHYVLGPIPYGADIVADGVMPDAERHEGTKAQRD